MINTKSIAMNKISKYLFGGALALGLWSCSSDEPTFTQIPTFEGDKAVMKISILTPGTDTRAGADGTTGDYATGSDDENYVRKLNFYFYDKAGEYVTCYEGAPYYPVDNSNSSALVEEVGTSKIVLTDLLGQNYPSYVVAVLNYNTGASGTTEDPRFKKHLNEVHKEVRSTNPWATSSSKITDFVMTSATHNGNAEDFYYFATPVTEENFAVQNPGDRPGDVWDETEAEPVKIYVERLAAKVELKFPGYTLAEEGYYQKTLPGNFSVDGVEQNLTVRLLGWGVNGTAKTMKYFKAVNDNPNPFKTTDGWDYSGTNRSYWAKTPGYGSNNYSSSFGDVEIKTGNPNTPDNDDCANDEPLNYISWETVSSNSFKNGKTVAYILPHTEAGEKINLTGNQIHHSALTEVLIAGQIVDAQGNPITLFQLSESYYTKDGLLNYLLNASGQHIWKKEGKKFVNIDSSDIDVTYGYDGTFKIKVINDEVTTWYQDNEGRYTWENSQAVADNINSYLPDQQSFCYNNGMMYYNIPIRHLRPYAAGDQIKTGVFGVVRNHWYEVSVGNVTNLGHSVYRPNEHIIPPSDDTRYKIGSSIRILSWRMVRQTAEL